MKKENISLMNILMIGRFVANDGSGGCSTCDGNPPAERMPTYLKAGTGQDRLRSGVAGWYGVHCSIAGTIDMSDKAAVLAAVAAGLLGGRLKGCRMKGSNGAPTPNTKNIGACNGDITSSITHSWNIQDYENDCEFSIDAFYDYFKCRTDFLFGAITCDYRIYPPRPVQNLAAYPQEADNSDECRYWVISWENKLDPCAPTGMIDGSWLQDAPAALVPPDVAGRTAVSTTSKKSTGSTSTSS